MRVSVTGIRLGPCSAMVIVVICVAVDLLFSWRAFAVNASPFPFDVNQPDGTKITLRVRGDEFYHWYEDLRGFTVVLDSGRYVYAGVDRIGDLFPTQFVVGHDDPLQRGLSAGIRPSAQAQERRRLQLTPVQRDVTDTAAAVAPVGTVKNLVILCKFSDHTFAAHTRPASDYDTIFNNNGPAALCPSGSVKDYYKETSYGTVTLNSTVVAWVTLPHTEAYYSAGLNGFGNYPTNAQSMIADALAAADALVNFGQFDTDNDGYIDAIDIIHSGYGAEWGGSAGNRIWSHKWSLYQVPGGQWTSADSNANNVKVKVYDYHTEPALWSTTGTNITRIGVVCHETGHFFGLPDLYDVDGSSEGIGSYCLMANSWGFDGSQLYPPHFSAWCKAQLGWLTATNLGTAGTYSVPMVETNKTAFKITSNYPSQEYLLIENRQPFGFESDMPQGGLCIWHIDETKPDNTAEGYPGQVGWPGNNKHYRVALLQADGFYDMELGFNRGDAGDVFHADGVNVIGPSTIPSTDTYQSGMVSMTGVSISGISSSSSTMSFVLSLAVGPAIIVAQPTNQNVVAGQSAIFNVVAGGQSPVSYQWRRNGSPVPEATRAQLILDPVALADAGTYSVFVTNSLGTATSTGAVLSVVSPITVSDGVDVFGLQITTGSTGVSNWFGEISETYDNVDAAQSGKLSNSESNWFQTTVIGPGTVSFRWKVSSEANYDFLRFSINSVPMASISGGVSWQQKTYAVGAGSQTLKWAFTKDDTVSVGKDAGWVDRITWTSSTPPTLSSSIFSRTNGGRFSFQLNGGVGSSYTVLVSDHLTNWTTLTNLAVTTNPFNFTDSAATNGQRYYRLLAQ